MPDGDKIHAHLAGRYQKIYKQLCENHFSEDDLAHNILSPLKEEIKNISNQEVVDVIKQISAKLDDLVLDIKFGGMINWDKEVLYIENCLKYANMKKSAKNIILDACQNQLQEIQQGAINSNVKIEIMKKYMIKIYEAKFESKIFLARHHHNDVDVATVRARTQNMRSYVWQGLLEFARQAIQSGDFQSLRRPYKRRNKFSNKDLDMDLTTALA